MGKMLIIKVFFFEINILEQADEVLLIILIEIIIIYIRNIILYKIINLKIK
jgi:hypothetical protein